VAGLKAITNRERWDRSEGVVGGFLRLQGTVSTKKGKDGKFTAESNRRGSNGRTNREWRMCGAGRVKDNVDLSGYPITK